MRILTLLTAMALLSATPSRSQEAEKMERPFLFTLSSNYGAWNASGVSSDGRQGLGMFQLSYDTLSWGATVSGTYANTSYLAATSTERFNVSTIADTSVSTYYMDRFGDFLLRGGLDLSLPTGKHAYSTSENQAIMVDTLSQDLMILNTYGAGPNIIPHFVVVYNMKPYTFGFGLRYEINGEYDPTTDTANDTIKPGARLLALVNAASTFGDNDMVMASISWSSLSKDQQGGKDVFRQGDTWMADIKYMRKWNVEFTTVLGLILKTQMKNEALTTSEYLQSEVSNSNNNSVEGYLSGVYSYSKNLAAQALVGYKVVGANGYSEGDSLYDAGLSKVYVEPGVSWYFSQAFYATGKLRYTMINNKADAMSAADATYNLVNADISLVYAF